MTRASGLKQSQCQARDRGWGMGDLIMSGSGSLKLVPNCLDYTQRNLNLTNLGDVLKQYYEGKIMF